MGNSCYNQIILTQLLKGIPMAKSSSYTAFIDGDAIKIIDQSGIEFETEIKRLEAGIAIQEKVGRRIIKTGVGIAGLCLLSALVNIWFHPMFLGLLALITIGVGTGIFFDNTNSNTINQHTRSLNLAKSELQDVISELDIQLDERKKLNSKSLFKETEYEQVFRK